MSKNLEVNNESNQIGKFRKIQYAGQQLTFDPFSNKILMGKVGDENDVFINVNTKESNINQIKLQDLQNQILSLLYYAQQLQSNLQQVDDKVEQVENDIEDLESQTNLIKANQEAFQKTTENKIQVIDQRIQNIIIDLKIIYNVLQNLKNERYNDLPLRKFINQLGAEILNLWNIKVEKEEVSEIVETKILPIETDVLELQNKYNEMQINMDSLNAQMTGNWVAMGLEFVLYQSQLIALFAAQAKSTALEATFTASIATLQAQVLALQTQLGIDNLVGEVVEQVVGEVAEQVAQTVGTSIFKKIGNYLKDNWLEITMSLVSSAVSTTAIDKAERLFQVLTIDNEEPGEVDENGYGLFYIDISQNIKMPTHELTAQSLRAAIGQIDNYDTLFNLHEERMDNIIKIIYQILNLPIPIDVGKQGEFIDDLQDGLIDKEINDNIYFIMNQHQQNATVSKVQRLLDAWIKNVQNMSQNNSTRFFNIETNATRIETSLNGRINSVQMNNTFQDNKINIQQEKTGFMQNNVMNLLTIVEERETTIQNIQTLLTSLQNTLSSSNTNITALQNQLNYTSTSQMKTEIENTKTNITTLQGQMAYTTTSNMKTQIENVKTSITTIQGQLAYTSTSQMKTEIETLKTTINTLQTQVNTLNQNNTTIDLLTRRINSTCFPIGTIITSLSSETMISLGVSQQFLKCDGSSFNSSIFPLLYSFLGTNVLPNLNGCVLRQSTNTSQLKTKYGTDNITLTEANLPAHCHDINYNTSGNKGGIWGSGNFTGGNFGNYTGGTQGYAYTAFKGSNQAYTHIPASYGVNYYIAATYQAPAYN